MTVIQSSSPGKNTDETSNRGIEGVPQGVYNPEGSVGSRGDTDNNLYYDDKLRSLVMGEIQKLVEVSENSVAKTLGGPFVSGSIC